MSWSVALLGVLSQPQARRLRLAAQGEAEALALALVGRLLWAREQAASWARAPAGASRGATLAIQLDGWGCCCCWC